MTTQAQAAVDDRTNPWATVLTASFGELMKGVHTMLPGVIESFDDSTQRAKVALANAIEKTDGSTVIMPALTEVPVMFYRWGNYVLTAPVTAGDECVVVFSERSLARFKQQGDTGQPPNEARFFDLSDGYCLPGSMSEAKAIDSFNTTDMELRTEDGSTKLAIGDGTLLYENGTGTLEIDAGKIKFENASGEVIDLISQILAQLKIETVIIPSGSSAGTYNLTGQSVYAAIQALWDTFKI